MKRCSFLLLLTLCTILTGFAAETTPAPFTAYVPFDSSKPLADQTPGRYFLNYETFQRLWKQARANKLQASAPPVTTDQSKPAWATLHTALYDARLEGNQLIIDATLSLQSSGTWAALDLAFTGANVGALTLDGQAAPLRDGKLLIEKSGPHVITAKLQIPLQPQWQSVQCALPPAAGTLFNLRLTEMAAVIKINQGVPTMETASADGVPARIITASLGNTKVLHLERSLSASAAQGAHALPSSAILNSALYLSPSLQRLEAKVQYQFPGGSHQDFTLDLDPSLTPTSVDIPHLETWTLTSTPEKKTLTFRLSLPARETLQVALTAERPAPPLPSKETFPQLIPAATRLEQTQLLLAVDELDVKPQPASTLQRKDFPDLKGSDAGFQRIAAFSSSGPPVPLPFAVSRQTLTTSLQSDYLYQISPSKLEVHAVMRLVAARGQDLLQTTIKVPAGFTVARVDSDRLQDWWVDGGDLQIRFSGATPEATTLLIGLSQSWVAPPEKLELVPLELNHIGLAKGRASIAALPDVNVSLNFGAQRASVIREIGIDEKPADYLSLGDFKLTTPFEHKRAFTFDSAQFAASVTLGKVPAKFDARWVLAAEVQESWVRIEARCDLEVNAGALNEITLSLPPRALAGAEPRITGELVREVTKIPAATPEAPATYKIFLQRPVTTATQILFSVEIPHKGEIHLPDLVFPDARITERFLAIQNGGAGELHHDAARSTHIEPLQAREVEKDLHFRIENFTQPLYFRAGTDWDLVLNLEKLATTTGTKAVVLYAELTSAVRPSGETWLLADYRLQNRTLQFLPVRLPAGYEFLSATVNREPVRADIGERDQLPVLLLPLIQTRPGDLSLDVRIVARKLSSGATLPDKFTLDLDDPELPGVTIERTVWKVALPPQYKLDDHTGNMEKTQAEDTLKEKSTSVTTELSSLVNLWRSSEQSEEVRSRSRLNALKIVDEYYETNAPQSAEVQQLVEQIKTPQAAPQQAPTQKARTQTDGTWTWSGNSEYLKKREQRWGELQNQEAQLNIDNLGINDNVIVSNPELFSKYRAPQQTPAEGTGTVNIRSSAVNKLQQVNFDDQEGTLNKQLQVIEGQRRDEGGYGVSDDRAKGKDQVAAGQPAAGTKPASGPANDAAQNETTRARSEVDFEQNYKNVGNRKSKAPVPAKPEGKNDEKPQAAAETPPATPPVDSAAPAVESLPPKLRPAGRVSLPIDFPITTSLVHFKKVKDHATLNIRAVQESSDTPHRISALLWLCSLMLLWFFLNALLKGRARRRALRLA